MFQLYMSLLGETLMRVEIELSDESQSFLELAKQ